MSQLQVHGFTTPNRCSKKKLYLDFFKNRQNLPDTFLLEMRKKKMGVTVLVFDPVQTQGKTIASMSNGLAMAQTVEL